MAMLGLFPLNPKAKPPTYGTDDAACFDIRACLDKQVTVFSADNEKCLHPVTIFEDAPEEDAYLVLNPGERAMIPTGFVFDIPKNHSLRIHPRSGLSLKKGIILANCESIIDHDYTNETFISLTNVSTQPFKITRYERLCQAEVVRDLRANLCMINEQPVRDSDRKGGLGSTGTK